jgi:glutaredoxin 3
VEEFLSQKGIAFEKRDVSQNSAYAQELTSKTGQMGVPVTIIDGQTVIGYDRRRLEEILTQRQSIPRPFGASIADASKITARQGEDVIMGAFVGNVKAGSVAERAGLVAGDIITELNMQSITDANGLEKALAKLNSGSRFSVVILRNGKTIVNEGVF